MLPTIAEIFSVIEASMRRGILGDEGLDMGGILVEMEMAGERVVGLPCGPNHERQKNVCEKIPNSNGLFVLRISRAPPATLG